ncbi:MAG: TonB-dependent receptor domain-containing protein, partial [Vicinamibacterales bacterium]
MRVACLVLTILLAVPFTSYAQTSGTLVGRAQDSSGAVLPGVTVTALQAERRIERSAITDASGRFVLAGLPAGLYEVRGELAGFRPIVRQGIQIAVGDAVVLELSLQVGGVDEAVTVMGSASTVNARTGELSYLVEERAIEQLPLNGRNYTDLAFLQPGVVPYPHRDGGSVVAHGLGMSVNGQDPRSNVYLLDGTLLNDMTNGPAGSAAATALGMETVREFRVETNAYSAEFGRNSGGQVNVITKSGGNVARGSVFEYHRNDTLDAKNYFDVPGKPPFTRNQFGGAVGGPVKRDTLFFFLGYEGLVENLGRTITSTVPDNNARLGLLPDATRPGELVTVGVNPAVAPYLNEYPRPNGQTLGDGTALYSFQFDQNIDQHFLQGRVDSNLTPGNQVFARYTFDNANQRLPMDYPQFPRAFLSRNQFFTGEYRQALGRMLNTYRLGVSRTRIDQNVEANTSAALAAFVPGRPLVGDIDVGGLQRFGPQSSANLRLVQNVFSGQYDSTLTRGNHLVKVGALAERYQLNMVNPTFSLGIYAFANLRNFLTNTATSFVGLRPEGAIDRYWRYTLVGLYAQDEYQASSRLTLTAGLRYEFTTLPKEKYGRDSALINLTDTQATVGPLYQNPTYTNLSPRAGAVWLPTGDGRTSVRGGYGLYFNTNNQQNLIVTVTNPPSTPRVVFPNPTFPAPPFERNSTNSIRPVQWELDNPRVHIWNANLQYEFWRQTVVTLGYAGSRGRHLLRSNDVNTAAPTRLADGTVFIPVGAPRPNTAWSTIELKSSDGDSWYKSFIVDVRRRWSNGFSLQSSYTWSDSEDTTQASTFFSDATNGTTSAFPEYVVDYNRGPSDFNTEHNWATNVSWDIPWGRNRQGVSGALLSGWRVAAIATARSGYPLTVFVQNNRSRSQWQPSLGPGIGRDRPSYAPGYDAESAVTGNPSQWFNPLAFLLQPAGTFGTIGRGDFTGPNLR